MASGVGCVVEHPPSNMEPHAFYFGEDQAAYVVAVPDAVAFIARAEAAHVPVAPLGRSGGTHLTLAEGISLSADRLREVNTAFFPNLMEQ